MGACVWVGDWGLPREKDFCFGRIFVWSDGGDWVGISLDLLRLTLITFRCYLIEFLFFPLKEGGEGAPFSLSLSTLFLFLFLLLFLFLSLSLYDSKYSVLASFFFFFFLGGGKGGGKGPPLHFVLFWFYTWEQKVWRRVRYE